MNVKALGCTRAAAKVKRIKKDVFALCMQEGYFGFLYLLPPQTLIYEMERTSKIVDENGKEIVPSGKFLITAETIDPYHLVVDFF